MGRRLRRRRRKNDRQPPQQRQRRLLDRQRRYGHRRNHGLEFHHRELRSRDPKRHRSQWRGANDLRGRQSQFHRRFRHHLRQSRTHRRQRHWRMAGGIIKTGPGRLVLNRNRQQLRRQQRRYRQHHHRRGRSCRRTGHRFPAASCLSTRRRRLPVNAPLLTPIGWYDEWYADTTTHLEQRRFRRQRRQIDRQHGWRRPNPQLERQRPQRHRRHR